MSMQKPGIAVWDIALRCECGPGANGEKKLQLPISRDESADNGGVFLAAMKRWHERHG